MLPVYCPLCCDQPFEDQDTLFHHLRTLRNNLFCPICSERFSSFDYLVSHLSRKCHGPLSPREAKRKCLYNKTQLPDTLDVLPPVSPNSIGSGNNQGEVPIESSALVRSDSVVAACAAPPHVIIPQEIRNRLSQGVTVSITQLEVKSKNELENENSVKNSSSKSEICDSSFSRVLNKVSLNRNVEICVKNSNDGNSVEKPVSNSSSVIIPSENTEPNLINKNSNLTCLKRDSFSVQDEIVTNNERITPKKTQIDIDESEIINGIRNQEKSISNTPIRRRGRPKKKFSPKITGKVNSKKSPQARENTQQSLNKIVSSDDNDHFEDVFSCSSNESEPIFGLKKKLNSSEVESSEPCKEEGITEENAIKSSVEPRLNIDIEKANVACDKNSSKTQFNNNGEPETKDVSTVDETNTTERDEPMEDTSMDPLKTDEEEEYTCSACNIRFTSIYEHIKQYHNGQEVVVEVPEEEIQEDLKVYQENSKASVSIGESDLTATEVEKPSLPQRPVTETGQSSAKARDKRKKGITGFSAQGLSEELVYTRTFKKVKQDNEHWVQLESDKKKLYQFVRDENKYQRIMDELGDNSNIHPGFNMPIKKLFENPKINVVEVTFKPNSPFLTYKNINFKNPMPMFIVERLTTNNPDLLGGIASYIMANKNSNTFSSDMEDSKVIGVMKVILASDNELTVENIVFNDKPANPDMVPVLEEVKKPDIPLLENAKILKWRCNRCLATTWKFPLYKESHFCNACPICHKTFISPVSLKKHLTLHKRDGTIYCKHCRAAFVSKATLNKHLGIHITHSLCEKCNLYVLRDDIDKHTEIHNRNASEQFPCSVCKKVFGSSQEMKCHEAKLCKKLVAQLNCSQCDKKFFSSTALAYHTAAHNKAAIKYRCRFCEKIFIEQKEQCPKTAGKRKPSSFIQKIWHERIHTRDRPYMCKSCPKRFRSLEHTMQHSKVHAPTESHPIPLRNVHVHMCIYCDRVFRSENHLTSHMVIHSTEAAG